MNSELPSLFFRSGLKQLSGLKLGRAFLRGIVSHARRHIKILSFFERGVRGTGKTEQEATEETEGAKETIQYLLGGGATAWSHLASWPGDC